MKHIAILVPKGAAALSCIEGPFNMFTKINEFLEIKGKPALFDVKLVGLSKEPEIYDKLFRVYPDATIGEIQKTDLIIIPAVNGDTEKRLLKRIKISSPWIVQKYEEGSEVASLCVGAFLLASTGLLKGKKCATHWVAENDFQKNVSRR